MHDLRLRNAAGRQVLRPVRDDPAGRTDAGRGIGRRRDGRVELTARGKLCSDTRACAGQACGRLERRDDSAAYAGRGASGRRVGRGRG